MDGSSFGSLGRARRPAYVPTVTRIVTQTAAIGATIVLAPVVLLLGLLVVLDSTGPMLVRVAIARADGRLGSRLVFRTHHRFDAEAHENRPQRQQATDFQRVLRWTGLHRLPGVLEAVVGAAGPVFHP